MRTTTKMPRVRRPARMRFMAVSPGGVDLGIAYWYSTQVDDQQSANLECVSLECGAPSTAFFLSKLPPFVPASICRRRMFSVSQRKKAVLGAPHSKETHSKWSLAEVPDREALDDPGEAEEGVLAVLAFVAHLVEDVGVQVVHVHEARVAVVRHVGAFERLHHGLGEQAIALLAHDLLVGHGRAEDGNAALVVGHGAGEVVDGGAEVLDAGRRVAGVEHQEHLAGELAEALAQLVASQSGPGQVVRLSVLGQEVELILLLDAVAREEDDRQVVWLHALAQRLELGA